MIDYASAWTELAAWIAAEPNRGRQQVLVKMAELSAKHTVDEEELERVMRVYGPQLLEELTHKIKPAGDPVGKEGPAATADGFKQVVPGGNAESVQPSIAA